MLIYWQDNEVRFDVNVSQLQMAAGESTLERVEQVEDSKANSGEPGCLILTNLRLIWYSAKTARLNLTVGYNTLTTISNPTTNFTKKKTATEALYLMSKTSSGKFEFLFTVLNTQRKMTNLPALLSDIHKCYVSSKPFRELRLRHHMIHAGQLKVLPQEHVCNRVEGVWNLASSQGNLGCFIISNVRIVWFASMNEYFNISLPYIQITQISIRDSKFGQVLVLEASESCGGYVLGFRIDPPSRLYQTLQEIQSLYLTQIRNPELGVAWTASAMNKVEDANEGTVLHRSQQSGKDKETSDAEAIVSCLANYRMMEDGANGMNDAHPPEFDKDLGLAIEKLPVGLERKTLWQNVL